MSKGVFFENCADHDDCVFIAQYGVDVLALDKQLKKPITIVLPVVQINGPIYSVYEDLESFELVEWNSHWSMQL
jgi:hypothetical protein